MEENRRKISFLSKLKNKYRFVVLTDDSFEERLSFSFSRINIIGFLSLLFLFLLSLSLALLIFSPLKEYIPGKSSSSVQKELIRITLETDSLKKALNIRALYLNNISSIMKGETLDFIKEDSINISNDNAINFSKSNEDSILRLEVEAEDKSSVTQMKSDNSRHLLFYSPLSGSISDPFDFKTEHYAVDIVGKKGSKVKSVLEGTVIVNSWNPQTGNVIGIQHANNFISFYKHCSLSLKQVGDFVSVGENIGIIGNTGELSTGPHLHFELWENGNPLNPEDYISFN